MLVAQNGDVVMPQKRSGVGTERCERCTEGGTESRGGESDNARMSSNTGASAGTRGLTTPPSSWTVRGPVGENTGQAHR